MVCCFDQHELAVAVLHAGDKVGNLSGQFEEQSYDEPFILDVVAVMGYSVKVAGQI